jgi:lambda family phage portal protein
MKLLDFFKPKKARKAVRMYQGAQNNRLFADFLTSTRSPDSEIRYALKVLRNRSRDLSRNNEYARRYLNLLKTNVVGERGVTLQVKAKNEDGTFDKVGNTIVENAWLRWTKLGNCTVDGKMTFVDAQRMFIESLARDGEVIVRLVNYDNDDKFAIEFIEPDQLDEEKNEILKDGKRVRMGVELNDYRRPIAYYMLTEHPGDLEYSRGLTRFHERVSADKILHIYLPDRAQQTRGVPWMAPAIESLKMLHGYREAELVAARTGASKMGFFTSPQGDGFTPDDMEEQFVPIMNAEPGTFHQLPAGVDFKAFDPNHPTTAFGDFEKAILRGIASGLGVSYYALANDLTAVSYSSIRAGELADRDFYKMLQNVMIHHFVEPVFRRWMLQAMTANRFPLPITKYNKFADNANFRARGFAWVDPQREIQANVIGLQNGILSLQDIANVYGRDVEETFEQIALEKTLADQYGVQMAFEPFGQKQQAVPTITGSAEPEAAPDQERSQTINIHPVLNGTFEVKSAPMDLNLKVETEVKKESKSIKLVRDSKGMVTGAVEE